jgi:hypothetical protein
MWFFSILFSTGFDNPKALFWLNGTGHFNKRQLTKTGKDSACLKS